jgi:hypothetical protein
MTSDAYKNFIRDVVYVLREVGAEAQRKSKTAGQSSTFDAGRALAYVEVLSLMQNQADAFQLSRDDLLLAGFDPEVDPIDPPSPVAR